MIVAMQNFIPDRLAVDRLPIPSEKNSPSTSSRKLYAQRARLRRLRKTSCFVSRHGFFRNLFSRAVRMENTSG
jgi:hypothetical protein